MRYERRFHHHYFDQKDQNWAERVEKMRQDFVANVSHELRTPLTVILGFLEVMIDQNAPELAPWQAILQQIYQQSQRMQSIVDDLLLLSRLETMPLEEAKYSPIDIPDMLERICKDARTLSGARAHQIHLECDESVKLNGIDSEIRSAFSNLVYNAVHYSPDQGNIWVKWSAQEGQARFSVKDTGIGIAAEHIPRITERFYRVDTARSRERGGTGLGLAIVKHVLLRHHAHLEINSVVGQGSEFICVFSPIMSRR